MTELTWPPRKVVCAGAVVLRNDKVLLIRQAPGQSFAGKWSTPWGLVEANEPPDVAAVRETLEEAGITAEFVAMLAANQHQTV